jgi:HK97 family phage portal protein
MSILFGRERRSAELTAAELILRDRYGTSSGVSATPEQAERHSAVWSCRAAVAEAVQQLPVEEVRTKAGKTVRRVPESPLFYDPHPGWTWEAWIWAQVWALAGCGKAYGYVNETARNGMPTSILPVEPGCVSWRWNRATSRWDVRLENEKIDLWPLGPLWHVPLYTTAACPEGMSPIAYHAESIGVGLAAQKFTGGFFSTGHPNYLLKAQPGTADPGQEGAARLKNLLMRALSGGSREPTIIPSGWDLDKVSLDPAETQFLETMRYSGEDVARVFGVPAEKIGLAVSGSSVTYANVADRNADWRTGGLSRYVRSLEASLSRLVPDGRGRVIRFDFDEFLRADPEGRYKNYKTAAEIGALAGTPVMTVNEMRAAEGLEPLPGGDVFVRPKQESQVQRSEQLELEIGGR